VSLPVCRLESENGAGRRAPCGRCLGRPTRLFSSLRNRALSVLERLVVVENRSQAEDARWYKEKERLEAALRRARGLGRPRRVHGTG
jgi:hypothetical protein